MFSRAIISKTFIVAGVFAVAAQAAGAQGFIKKDNALPDSSHFYMSRMQVQLIDEAPIVTRQSNPGSAQGGSNQIPGVPARGLPRAGFQSYSPETPQLSNSLPRVNNGVPRKLGPQDKVASGAHASAGKLPPPKPKVIAPKGVEAYAPYRGWSPEGVGTSAAANQTKSNVRGSVLHWARGNR